MGQIHIAHRQKERGIEKMSVGKLIQIVGAFLLLLWALKTALIWSKAGIAGAFQGIGAFLLVIGVIAVIGVPVVDWVYTRFRTQLPSTQVAQDAEAVINTGVGVFGDPPPSGWLAAAPESVAQTEQGPWGVAAEVSEVPVPVVATAAPSAQAVATLVPQVQVQRQLIQDPTELAECWRTEAMKAGLQAAQAGGTTWFPSGTPCSIRMYSGTGFFSRNRWFVTCLDLGLNDLQVMKGLGQQLQKAAGAGGTFYGSGSWPPACYITPPEPEAVSPSPTATPPPSATPAEIQPTTVPVVSATATPPPPSEEGALGTSCQGHQKGESHPSGNICSKDCGWVWRSASGGCP